MDRPAFLAWRAAYNAFVDCGQSDRPRADCIAGWRRDAARFIPAGSERVVESLAGYYIDSRLRASPGGARPLLPALADGGEQGLADRGHVGLEPRRERRRRTGRPRPTTCPMARPILSVAPQRPSARRTHLTGWPTRTPASAIALCQACASSKLAPPAFSADRSSVESVRISIGWVSASSTWPGG